MKRIYFFFFIISLLFGFSTQAQNTEGTEFWLTFGKNSTNVSDSLDLQVRIVGGGEPTTGSIYFTNTGTSVPFNIAARQVFTYNLNNTQKQAVYDPAIGKTNHSIRITSDKPVTVYAINQRNATTDATNVLPITALGGEYFQISYLTVYTQSTKLLDAYAVIGTQNNTNLYHNGVLETTLNAGDVYYKTSNGDMTGAHITSNNPIAFFALNQGAYIPEGSGYLDCLMQQLAPVNTWGKKVFVPVSHLTRDRVRVVASQDNTNIIQIGGILKSVQGSQMNLTNLMAGQFIELEVSLNNNGCYIQSNKPIGVCSYLTGSQYNEPYMGVRISDPAQCWLPSIEQTVADALIAPFIPDGVTKLTDHYALIITPANAKNNTKVSIGGGTATVLSGGIWRDNAAAGMSFYTLPLSYPNASYYFTNSAGLIILCYGVGPDESYYYLAYSAMRNLDAVFYGNDIHYQNLPDTVFCINDIVFRADISQTNTEIESLQWYINEVEEVSVRDQITWNKNLPAGKYDIKMVLHSVDKDTIILTSILHIGAHITTLPLPPEGGSTTGDGCYKVGNQVTAIAVPNFGYTFVNWTEDNAIVSTNSFYAFTATQNRILVANFEKHTLDFDTYTVIICNRIILINLRKLAEDGYEVIGCEWFKNGIEVQETHMQNEFSYAEGAGKLLDVAPAYYNYCLIIKDYGKLYSSEKIIIEYTKSSDCNEVDELNYLNELLVYPNPVMSGSLLTIEGLVKDSPIYVYNHLGDCVFSGIAVENSMLIVLELPSGIYLMRNEDKIVKIVIVK